ncbi:MAG: hypothetical protein ACRC8W_19300 [Plesiomonas shigelloides]
MKRIKVNERMVKTVALLVICGGKTVREVTAQSRGLYPNTQSAQLSMRRMVRMGMLQVIKEQNGYNVKYAPTQHMLSCVHNFSDEAFDSKDPAWRVAKDVVAMPAFINFVDSTKGLA